LSRWRGLENVGLATSEVGSCLYPAPPLVDLGTVLRSS
jgi:hypothetical protein